MMATLNSSFDLKRSEAAWVKLAIYMMIFFVILSVGAVLYSYQVTNDGGQGNTELQDNSNQTLKVESKESLPIEGGQGST